MRGLAPCNLSSAQAMNSARNEYHKPCNFSPHLDTQQVVAGSTQRTLRLSQCGPVFQRQLWGCRKGRRKKGSAATKHISPLLLRYAPALPPAPNMPCMQLPMHPNRSPAAPTAP